MENSTKWILGGIATVVVIGGVVYYFKVIKPQSAASLPPADTNTTGTVKNVPIASTNGGGGGGSAPVPNFGRGRNVGGAISANSAPKANTGGGGGGASIPAPKLSADGENFFGAAGRPVNHSNKSEKPPKWKFKGFKGNSGTSPVGTYTGGATSGGIGLGWTISDVSVKENITPMANGLAAIMQLKPCEYKYKAVKGNHTGLIAQEVKSVIPTAVKKHKKLLAINYAEIVPVLIKAVQEQQIEITELKARLN